MSTAKVLKVLSKGGQNSVTVTEGMTVGDVRESLGIPDHLTANANGSQMNDDQFIGDITRISFTRGSENNADNSNVATDDLVKSVSETMAQAEMAHTVFMNACDKKTKVDCGASLRNAIQGDVMDADDALAILKSLPNRLPELPELLLRSAGDETVAKFLVKTAKTLSKVLGRDGQFSQV